MFPNSDPQIQLDLFHHRADELIREAALSRLARASAPAGRHRRVFRRPRRVHAPVTP